MPRGAPPCAAAPPAASPRSSRAGVPARRAGRSPDRTASSTRQSGYYILHYMNSLAGELQRFKAEFFRALAHPIRIGILEALLQGERSVQELQEILGVDQPVGSQQLAVLRAKNIVAGRKEGTSVRYLVGDRMTGDLLAVARRIFNNHLVGTQGLLRELQRQERRRS